MGGEGGHNNLSLFAGYHMRGGGGTRISQRISGGLSNKGEIYKKKINGHSTPLDRL